jgi:hypothetical protein
MRSSIPAVGQDPALFAAGETEVPALNFTIGFASQSRVFAVREATDRRQTGALMRVATEKTSQLPGLFSFSSRGSIFAGNFGGTRSINIDISGPDLATLFDAASKVQAKAKAIFDRPRVKSEPSSLTLGQPMLEVRRTGSGPRSSASPPATWATRSGPTRTAPSSTSSSSTTTRSTSFCTAPPATSSARRTWSG